MTRRLLALTLAMSLTACQPPTTEQAPSFTANTVTADLPDPQGLARGPEGLLVSTSRGILYLGPDDPLTPLPSGGALQDPAGLDWNGEAVLVADPGANRVWRVPMGTGSATPFAGTGTALVPIGDEGPATSAQLNSPLDVVVAEDGTAYLADAGNARVRRVRDGRISTVPGTEEAFERPTALALTSEGGLLVVDSALGELKRISPDGTVQVLAENLDNPQGVLQTRTGILVSETGRNRVVWVGPSGRVVPVAGGGSSTAEEGPGTQLALNHPTHLASSNAEVYLLDGNRILQLTAQATP